MKKTLFLLIALAIVLLLASCGTDGEVSKTPDVSTDTSNVDSSVSPDVSEDESVVPEISEPDVSEPDVSEPDVSEPETSEPEVVILDYTSNFGGQKLIDISGNEADRANPFKFYGTWNLNVPTTVHMTSW